MKNNIFLTSDATTVIHDVVKHFDFENKKRVLFVETSGEIHEGERPWIDNAKKKMKELGFDVTDYTITGKEESDIEKALSEVDIVYVAGGNNVYLLQKSQESNFEKIIKEFIKKGGVYIGQSAGSVVAGPSIYPAGKKEPREFYDKLDNFDGFNLVDFVIFPHFGRSEKRELFFKKKLPYAYSEKYKIILLTDKQYVRVQEDGMYKIEEV
jgi:dipeptidase E